MSLEYNCEMFRKNLHKLWQEDKYCDVSLIGADGMTKIRAHRLVLEAVSPYFEDRTPNATGNINEIVVEAVDSDTLRQLVGMCYSGWLDVNENNVLSLYMGAIHLQLRDLLPELDSYIATQLNNCNCLHFYKFAETFSRSVLFGATEHYICEHFIEICDQPSFWELNGPYLNKLLTLEKLQVPSAEDLFLKIIKWVHHLPEHQRDGTLAELLPNLKLSLMSKQFLMEQVNPFCKTIETKDIVMAALSGKLETIPPVSFQIERERLLVVTGRYPQNHKIIEYSFEQQHWKTLAVLPTAINDFSVVYSMTWNSICFIGGTLNDSEINNFLLWNLQSRKFMKMVKLPEARSHVSAISLNADGDLIVVGGWDGKKVLSTVERWRCETGNWHTLESTKVRKYCSSLVTVDNVIYSIGGLNVKGCIKTVECYNLADDQWSIISPLHHARHFCGTMYHGEKVYVIGGGSDVIECYDPDINEWTEISIVKDSADVRACVRYNGCIVAFGPNAVLISDGDWKIWKKSNSIPTIDCCIFGGFSISPQ